MNTLVEQKRQFLKYLKTERGRSERTVENYDRYLTRFIQFVKIKTVSDLTEEQVHKFCLYLDCQPGTKVSGRVEPMKCRTKNYYLIALRSFLKFLRVRGIKALSPERVKLAKVPERSIDRVTVADLKRLMNAPDTKTIEGKRDKAILALLFSTGLRISELCNLSIGDVVVLHDEVSITSKNGKARIVAFPYSTRMAVQDYLKHRNDTDKALFVRYGRKMHDGGDLRIHPRAVQRLIKRHAVIAGVTNKVTPQMIRHSFADTLLSQGFELREVQSLLGHVSVNTTKVYTHGTNKQSKKV